ncbi:hypothetical protein [Riemerella anatipestifer]|uniref:hypothetical protein n=1 Tax=Riemerella anatipestifer TaxID=34085 RepID=UPI001BDA512E|nr:hypothetical protein [Riemerella anatipestifer]MBT0551019.1 hypothetical protein [Riemerella anatipestifer]MBT0553635.1 hypothetical protein [Riemerella anatipestifer]MCU7559800.1 hypothetical protein [Riemerella anatipestifer]MDY3449029.1 hypothetical protein [Riemerella anatipestifer]QYR04360.1 hypothetical protein J6M09_07870 [Riemerella anatipestifer]
MKKIIHFFVIINTVLFHSQTVKININAITDNKISITICSNKELVLNEKLLYANDWIYQVSTLGISKNQLTLFVYNEKNKLIDSGVASRTLGKTDISPEEYEKLRKIDEKKKQNSRIFIPLNNHKEIHLDFRIFNSVEDVFKIYPCTMFGCWYDFYTLEKGKKYKLQIQLKVNSKIYKSNVVEFTY